MKLNIAVVFGSKSVEHEISIISAMQCMQAIDKEKYDVTPIYITKQGVWYTGEKLLNIDSYKNIDRLLTQCNKIVLPQNANEHIILRSPAGIFGDKVLGKIDVVFPMIHGTYGEDGLLQGFLEFMNVPYVGCDVLSSAITMDKITTKMCLKSLDIPVLDYIWFYSSEWVNDQQQVISKVENRFKYPVIVKPGNLGSSIGITIVKNQAELEDAVDLAVGISARVLIEPAIINLKEVNCAVLGDYESAEISICEEPIAKEAILSYQDKYISENAQEGVSCSEGMSSAKRKIPAEISVDMTKTIHEYAKKAFMLLNCSGVSRIDFMIDQDTNNVYLCELNTLPGSLAFYLWEPMGKSFKELTSQLIGLALKRHREKSHLTFSYDTNILSTFSGGLKGGKFGSKV